MSYEKKLKQILRKHYFDRVLEKTLKFVETDAIKELGVVAQQIRFFFDQERKYLNAHFPVADPFRKAMDKMLDRMEETFLGLLVEQEGEKP